MRSILLKVLATGGMLALTGSHLFAANVVTDLMADLAGPQSNPYLTYSYGYENTLGGAFTLYTTLSSNGTLRYFNPGNGLPLVGADPNGGTHFNTEIAASSEAILHPGAQGQYAVIRFTTPTTGKYNVSGLFSGQDTAGTTTDVHILVDGVANFNANISGFSGIGGGTAFGVNPMQNFSMASLMLTAGDTLDFAVGFGTNGNFSNDSTGLQATITATPEPGSLALLFAATGLLVAGKMKFRRSN